MPGQSPLLTDRIFRAFPAPPALVGALFAAGLVGLLLGTTALAGELQEFIARDEHWWADRDARLSILAVLLVSFMPVLRRYYDRATLRNFEALAGQPWPAGTFDRSNLDRALAPGARRTAVGMLLVPPLVGLLVDRDPALYLTADYWRVVSVWTWGLGCAAAWHIGLITHRILSDARQFSRLGAALPDVDLLERRAFLPFARQGLVSAMPALLTCSLFALNFIDRGFSAAAPFMLTIPVATGVTGMLLPVLGARRRIREEKAAEVARVNAAIRGEPAALAGSPIERAVGGPGAGLADLLAWRGFVQASSEWPFDAPTLVRFALYLALPLGSWLGGALVERLVDAAF